MNVQSKCFRKIFFFIYTGIQSWKACRRKLAIEPFCFLYGEGRFVRVKLDSSAEREFVERPREGEFISESDLNISLYPNPAQDQINIKFNFVEEGDYQYELFDTKGSKVANGTLTGTEGTQTIDLTNLTNGVYLYRLKNGIELISTQKIIINR